jgi:hypothetical protein
MSCTEPGVAGEPLPPPGWLALPGLVVVAEAACADVGWLSSRRASTMPATRTATTPIAATTTQRLRREVGGAAWTTAGAASSPPPSTAGGTSTAVGSG